MNKDILDDVEILLQETLKDLHLIRDCWLLSIESYRSLQENYILISLWHEDQDDWSGRKWTKKAQTYIETLLSTKLEKKKIYDIDPALKGSYEVLIIKKEHLDKLYTVLRICN